MALSGTALGTEIHNVVQALSNADKADSEKCWQAIAGAIIDHFKNNGTVLIKNTDGGLQRAPASLDPTIAPATTKTLPPGCIQ